MFRSGDAGLTVAHSWQYQRDHDTLPEETRYAQIPTVNGEPLTLARSWAWAIVTQDPVRQEAAAHYIVSTLEPERLSSWISANSRLPTHRSILPLSIIDDEYRTFADTQLQHAYPYPSSRALSQIGVAIMRAIDDVLDGGATSESAAATAAAAVERLR